MNCLSPSILSADYGKLAEEIERIDEAGAQYVHIDVMDGMFVPSISFGMPVIRSIRGCTDRIFDVHLMIEEPGRYIDEFAEAGADLITVHAESCRHLDRTIEKIKEKGLLAGVALNPATPVSAISCVLEKVDMVLIMTVNPGFGGQKLIPYTVEKVRELRKIVDEQGLKTDIEVDGGVNLSNVGELMDAGANIIVAGSAVFSGDVTENTIRFLNIINA
jgi:ribulose-phosphate 3-epimerase